MKFPVFVMCHFKVPGNPYRKQMGTFIYNIVLFIYDFLLSTCKLYTEKQWILEYFCLLGFLYLMGNTVTVFLLFDTVLCAYFMPQN